MRKKRKFPTLVTKVVVCMRRSSYLYASFTVLGSIRIGKRVKKRFQTPPGRYKHGARKRVDGDWFYQ